MFCLLLPFRRRYDANPLGGQFDAGFFSQAKLMGKGGHGIDAHALTNSVEIDIARMDQRFAQIDRSVSGGLNSPPSGRKPPHSGKSWESARTGSLKRHRQ